MQEWHECVSFEVNLDFCSAGIGGWRQQIEGMIRVALSLPINEGGVKRRGA